MHAHETGFLYICLDFSLKFILKCGQYDITSKMEIDTVTTLGYKYSSHREIRMIPKENFEEEMVKVDGPGCCRTEKFHQDGSKYVFCGSDKLAAQIKKNHIFQREGHQQQSPSFQYFGVYTHRSLMNGL